MKGSPASPGGSLASKPTWSDTSGCSTTSAFLSTTEDEAKITHLHTRN